MWSCRWPTLSLVSTIRICYLYFPCTSSSPDHFAKKITEVYRVSAVCHPWITFFLANPFYCLQSEIAEKGDHPQHTNQLDASAYSAENCKKRFSMELPMMWSQVEIMAFQLLQTDQPCAYRPNWIQSIITKYLVRKLATSKVRFKSITHTMEVFLLNNKIIRNEVSTGTYFSRADRHVTFSYLFRFGGRDRGAMLSMHLNKHFCTGLICWVTSFLSDWWHMILRGSWLKDW